MKIEFLPVREEHLSLLRKWLREPHVSEFWQETEDEKEFREKFLNKLPERGVSSFVIALGEKPIGYIQHYEACKVGGGWWPEAKEGTFGIDQFIGDAALVGRGLGTKVIKQFVDDLFLRPEVIEVITDPEPKNKRAIRSYEKAGFTSVSEIQTPGGPALLMRIVRPASRSRVHHYDKLGVGLERDGSVRLSNYNSNWTNVFSAEAKCLFQSLNLPHLKLFHIGSTSVTGLRAKPVIDVLGIVGSHSELDARTNTFGNLGYEYKGEYGIPGRRYAVLYNQEKTKGYVHLHFYEEGHPEIEKHLLFRDYLRTDRRVKEKYESEKRRLAEDLKIERSKYPDAKSGCIGSILAEANSSQISVNYHDYWKPEIRIRLINKGSVSEIELVAHRMRETLIEVLGQDEGGSMYTMDWLKQRVLFHLDPGLSTAQVYVAESETGDIVGHTIVRIDKNDRGNEIGLFSTTFVSPDFRKQGVAKALLERGERWIFDKGLSEAATYTSETNTKLINLYVLHGYAITGTYPEKKMIKLSKTLDGA